MSRSSLYSLVLLLPAMAQAANDWNKPCLSGSCSYDAVNSNKTHTTPIATLHLVRLHLLSYLSTSVTDIDHDVHRTAQPLPSLI